MLSGIDRERLADELHELRLDLVAAEGEFTRDSIALAIENIGALLPEGCERLEDRSAADRVRRIKRLCEELADTIDGETSIDVPLPDLARRCWQLARGLRPMPATDQDAAVAIVGGTGGAIDGQSRDDPPATPPTWLSSTDLAVHFKLQEKQVALNKRLQRWRLQNGNGWTEVPDVGRPSRGPKFLYDPKAVMDIIDALRAK